MITQKDIDSIDHKYFQVIECNGSCVCLKSLNTKHYWCIVSSGISLEHKYFKLYHKHHYEDQFHFQKNIGNFKSAIYEIKKHDEFQLGGRK